MEARYLRSLSTPPPSARAFVLAGDLNSLSRADPYPVDLADRVRRAGVDKYGHPPRFDVIDDLEAFGWVDTLRHRPASPDWVTARREREGRGHRLPHGLRLRLALAGPAAARGPGGGRGHGLSTTTP